MARDVVDHVLDADHALRSTEPAESGVGDRVRLATERQDADVVEVVAIVAVEHRTVVDRPGEIRRVAAAAREDEVDAEDASLVVESDLVLGDEIVPLAGQHHVVVAVDAQLHGPAGPAREECGDAREEARLAFLAAEAAAHPPALDDDVARRQIERVRDLVLHLARMLRGAVYVHRAVFPRHGVGDHPLEVELLLPADANLALEAVGRSRDRGARIAADQPLGGQHERLLLERRFRRQHRLQVLVVDGGEPRRLARLHVRARRDREQRLPVVLDERRREDRVVGDDRAVIVLAGNVLRRDDGDHARRRAHLREVHRPDARVRALGEADRRVQRAARLGNVVDVRGFAADVQVSAVVGKRGADAAAQLGGGRCERHGHLTGSRTRVATPRPLVSRNSRCSRLRVTVRRYAALARMSVSGV